jgi:hypothetical protein
MPRRNAPWTPLQRQAWLALQRHDHRRLPAPVLAALYPGLLAWVWAFANPWKWNVWQSTDGGVSYFLVADYWAVGTARQFDPDGGSELYFIVGVNETGREVTQRSNAVRPDDAPIPH